MLLLAVDGVSQQQPNPTPHSKYLQEFMPSIPDPMAEFKRYAPQSPIPGQNNHVRPFNDRVRHQNEAIMNGYNQNRARQQALIDEAYRDMEMSEEERIYLRDFKNYRTTWNDLVGMINTGEGSLKDAIYKVETALMPGYMSYEEYIHHINEAVGDIYLAMEVEGYDCEDELAKKMMLHRYMCGIMEIIGENGKHIKRTRSMRYDFVDPFGEKDFSNYMVLKLIKTRSGQCHSLPLFYLIMAEELGFDAWLSMAPNHSFIKIKDKHGKLLNLELTNGHYTNDQFMMQSGYIGTRSVRLGIFLDTLNKERVLLRCLNDLTGYYIKKYGYMPFLKQDLETLIKADGSNLGAWLELSNFATVHFDVGVKEAGYPKPEELKNYKRLSELLDWRNSLYKTIDGFGYTSMTLEKYKNWLASFNDANKQNIIRP